MEEKMIAINNLFNNIVAGNAGKKEIDLLIAWMQSIQLSQQSMLTDEAICDLCKMLLDKRGTCSLCTLACPPHHECRP